MIDLLIDAPLLACPKEDLGDDEFNIEFLEFVTALSELSRFRRSLSFSRVWRESTLASTLYEIDAYPFKHAISKAMHRLDPELGFQLEDISSLASSLLSKSNCINDFTNLEDMVVQNCTISNDTISNRCQNLKEYVCRVTEFAIDHLGVSVALPDSVKIASRIKKNVNAPSELEYQLNMVSFRDGTMECPGTPRKIAMEFFCGSERTLGNLDPIEIWMKAENALLLDALAIFAAKQGDVPYESLSEFKNKVKVGEGFIDTCRKLGFLHEPAKIGRLIGACVDICVGRNLNKSHWLRKGMGANEPQKKRDDGKTAWRHDIDDEFHLHYWRNGILIELANVVVHNDFSIS